MTMAPHIFPCPACGRTIAADVPPGQRVQCPLCNQVVTVPHPRNPPFATPANAVTHSPMPPPLPLPPPEIAPGVEPLTYAHPMRHPPANGLAIASFIFGILGVLGICLWGLGAVAGLVALALGIAAIIQIRRDPQRTGARGLAVAGLVMGGISVVVGPILVFFVMLPAFRGIAAFSQRSMCQVQVHAIAAALQQYAARDPNGRYPDDLRHLPSGALPPQMLRCPQDVTGGISYLYVPGFSPNDSPRQVILYEHPDIHLADGGGHVLYADGTVIFETGAQYRKVINNITLPTGDRFAPHQD